MKILPIDSEHNAIYQVLDFKNKSLISKLILTASGGPFLNHSFEQLKKVTPKQAIKHQIGLWEKKSLLILLQ